MIRGLVYCLALVIMTIIAGEVGYFILMPFLLGYSTTAILKKIDELQSSLEDKNKENNTGKREDAETLGQAIDTPAASQGVVSSTAEERIAVLEAKAENKTAKTDEMEEFRKFFQDLPDKLVTGADGKL